MKITPLQNYVSNLLSSIVQFQFGGMELSKPFGIYFVFASEQTRFRSLSICKSSFLTIVWYLCTVLKFVITFAISCRLHSSVFFLNNFLYQSNKFRREIIMQLLTNDLVEWSQTIGQAAVNLK